jgi:hypothetical protein
MVDAADNRLSFSSLSADRFTEKMEQFYWCAGYLGAIHDIHTQNRVNLVIVGAMGVTLAGPNKERAVALLRGPCIPDEASILQLARVLVKWLREHPEKLHEPKSTLTLAAFEDAFPCQHASPSQEVSPREATKPTTAKP